MTSTALKVKLFPTWVGVIPRDKNIRNSNNAFPHMGGGDPKSLAKTLLCSFFSPHGWG